MLKFSKMHGLGNDFLIFDGINDKLPEYSVLAKKTCDRHFGVGADGILIIEGSSKSDIKMLIFNADGSQASMCGNGIRCFAKFVYENNYIKEKNFTVETLAGVIKPEVFVHSGEVSSVRVNMGEPKISFDTKLSDTEGVDIVDKAYIKTEINIEGNSFIGYTTTIGVVHTVIFIDDYENIDIKKIGPYIETHPILPVSTNVNFCRIVDNKTIEVKTWEIGAGQTLACGTGAASSAYLSSIVFNMDSKINANLDGGTVEIEKSNNLIYMTGPATSICNGYFNW